MRKVGLIGCGHVGATVALDIVQGGFADELVIIDKDRKKAEAEVLDLLDALALLPFYVKIYVGEYDDLATADIVLSTLGHIELIKPGGDRFTELKANIPEIKEVSEQLNRINFKGILIATTNPNDVIVNIYSQLLNLPKSQIIGTGTYLDTARMKAQVSRALEIDARSVEGYVLGEHGNSQFTAWSTVRVGGQSFLEIAKEKNLNLKDLEEKARQGGFAVFNTKGYTNVAIAAATVFLMNLVLSDAKNIAICSHYDEKFSSYISTPALIGKNGIEALIKLPLTLEEEGKLKNSVVEIQEKINYFS
ncbi:lactate/malate family dehydrogenase [Lactococcus cremoris]|uniref:Malate dehydrogenase (NAD) n=1 Tax=Lactococcus cremoris subsp. cremoris GE214 TaxID=1415168 RepID=A0A084AEA2_LACLC|nr:L-2-hydroxyisocaproate dehydrogenase [Lactococcus cremoris]KEY63631.1 Malate dehydrogenase (NAD) [Lactococcus cremoris subsp. cremoris GE214]